MSNQIPLSDFLEKANDALVIDVRTPLEFVQGHIPDAINIPIFTNEERVLVGTTYKQKGKQPAILLGFELTGNKWSDFIREVEKLADNKKILVHCWRGGMRSGAMAWAFGLYGFEVSTLKGGYKAFRKANIESFSDSYQFKILSGFTGSAKTEILNEMKTMGEQVIDLESLAQHQGSSFGSMGRMTQPSQEQFENLFGMELQKMDVSKRIWLEDESVTIGKRVIPKSIWDQMRNSDVIKIEISKEERVDFLNKNYGSLDKEFLKDAVLGIAKRLGPLETKLTLQAIDENRMKDFINQVLVYYDKTYIKGLSNRNQELIKTLEFKRIEPKENAKSIISFTNKING
ncbi:tRNA 2-selenouridine(34) synthase MnmH [Pedobacter psychrophilus]|uniref:tRNA 2-selenouridine(34) synthase MnmH n=1 Tax=Pedobacter psychrophilus TaxID=1826909 RepID=A0A179DM45_9SPHI|nr:tRNA 2-selenouridine(34) synthase MnmH [Pedobacter psychrophilus]OAQ42121.1 tRNA 2-selenouridine(34) synthase MnmH [Pedobacter psychrophilus]